MAGSKAGRGGTPLWVVLLFQVVPSLLLALAMALLSVPLAPALMLAPLAVALLYRADRAAPLLLGVSVLLTALLLNLLVAWQAPRASYYRPHEYLLADPFYRPNQTVAGFRIPHGDLYAIANATVPGIAEPRVVNFQTDSLGLRNTRDFRPGDIVMLGDSFVTGNGNTQWATLPVQVDERLLQSVYNAGFPGPPEGYARWYRDYIRPLVDAAGQASPVVLFLYDGNDFECAGDPGYQPPERPWYGLTPTWISERAVYRVSYGLTRRAWFALAGVDAEGGITVREVGGRSMAFLRRYIEQATRASGCADTLAATFAELRGEIGYVVFIPDKYRVYHFAFGTDGPPPTATNPDTARRLAESLGARFLDLTPALEAAARRLAPRGEFVYWRDDTHWNPAGIVVAAEAVTAMLREDLAPRRGLLPAATQPSAR